MADGRQIEIVVPVLVRPGGTLWDGALRATLQSLLDQTATGFEVRIVCPLDVEPDLPVADERFRTTRVSASGLGDLLAAALATGDSEWVRFLPPGDQLAPSCVAAEAEVMRSDASPAVLFAEAEAVDADGARLAVATSPAIAPGRYEPGALVPEVIAANPLPLGAGLLRRDAAVELGGFDPSLCARPEHDLWLRLLRAYPVVQRAGPGLRRRTPPLEPAEPAVDGAEHARILLRALRGEALEDVVRALGGGERDSAAQGIARAELARRVLAVGRAELAPLAVRLVREARAAGAYFPVDEPFAILAVEWPELARPEGWFPPPAPVDGAPVLATALGGDGAAVLATGPTTRSFPDAARVGLATSDADEGAREIEAARALTARCEALREHGIDLVVLHARSSRESPAPVFDAPTEILRHPGSVDEAEAALARRRVALVVGDSSHPATAAARRRGIPVRAQWPGAEADAAELARAWLREAATAAAHGRRAAVRERESAARAVAVGSADDGLLRALAGALGDAGQAARTAAGADLAERLAAAREEAAGVHRRIGEASALAGRALDKLRIGHRLRQAFVAPGRDGAGPAATVRSLDPARARRFLENVAAADHARLWVVYTTDPYSETQGQRSTWLARELLARGDFVVFFYWRWHLSDQIAESAHERMLVAPIDQLFRLQWPLMELAAPGLEKILLIEFPDMHLFEQIDLAGAHGFTTVYDCVDDWEEFARLGHAHWYDPGMERHLVRHADVVVATHPVLVRRLREMGHADVALVPNGVALDALADAPPRARQGPPVIGYFGHLTPAWFDWDLIRETADAHPEWTFEILGPGAPEDLSLPDNVRVPGPVPHADLDRRTRAWHVGVVPFRPGRLTDAVDPIKLYEYLALGLPSVVVAMPHLHGVPGVEVCAREDFGAAVARALAAELDRDAVRAFLAASRWAVRADALAAAIAGPRPEGLLKAL